METRNINADGLVEKIAIYSRKMDFVVEWNEARIEKREREKRGGVLRNRRK